MFLKQLIFTIVFVVELLGADQSNMFSSGAIVRYAHALNDSKQTVNHTWEDVF